MVTKEEAIKQRNAQRRMVANRAGTGHFFILDLSKMPGADVSGLGPA